MLESILGLKTDQNTCNIFEFYDCSKLKINDKLLKEYVKNNVYLSFKPEDDKDDNNNIFETFDNAFDAINKNANMNAILFDKNNNTYKIIENPNTISKSNSNYNTFVIPNIENMCQLNNFKPSDLCSYFNKIYGMITGTSNFSGGGCNNGVIGTYSISDPLCDNNRPYGGSSNVYYNFDNIPSQDDINKLMGKMTINISNIIENIVNIKIQNETNIGVNSRTTINISKSFIKGNVINNNSIIVNAITKNEIISNASFYVQSVNNMLYDILSFLQGLFNNENIVNAIQDSITNIKNDTHIQNTTNIFIENASNIFVSNDQNININQTNVYGDVIINNEIYVKSIIENIVDILSDIKLENDEVQKQLNTIKRHYTTINPSHTNNIDTSISFIFIICILSFLFFIVIFFIKKYN